jgi:hypothetical protein
MRDLRVVAATGLALALVVTGCGLRGESVRGESVTLLTGVPALVGGDDGAWDRGCFTNWVSGTLVTHPEWGTAVVTDGGPGVGPSTTSIVAWPPGYTGLRVESAVEVHNGNGNLVAVTGRHYDKLPGGFAEVGGVQTFWSCDTPS